MCIRWCSLFFIAGILFLWFLSHILRKSKGSNTDTALRYWTQYHILVLKMGKSGILEAKRYLQKDTFKKIPSKWYLQKDTFKKIPSKRYLQNDTFKKIPSKRYLQKDTFRKIPSKRYLHNDTFKNIPLKRYLQKDFCSCLNCNHFRKVR